MELKAAKKILIIRLSSLGDVLLTTPILRSLKSQFSYLEIDFVIRKEFLDALKHNPNLSNVYIYNSNEKNEDLLNTLRRNNYDLVLDLQNNFRSKAFVGKLSKPVLKFRKPTIKKFLLVNFRINLFKKIISIPERYAYAIPELDLDDKGLDLFIPNTIRTNLNDNEKLIGFCPGSKHFSKMWPEEYFVNLGIKFINEGYKIVLIGGKDDKEICKKINEKISEALNLCRDDNLLQIGADMKACKLVICNDSGMMHTASAVNVPVVAIFGSTVKEFGFTPYKATNLVLENNSLSCRPCSHIGKNLCPRKHFKCMKEITPEIVFNKTINFLNSL